MLAQFLFESAQIDDAKFCSNDNYIALTQVDFSHHSLFFSIILALQGLRTYLCLYPIIAVPALPCAWNCISVQTSTWCTWPSLYLEPATTPNRDCVLTCSHIQPRFVKLVSLFSFLCRHTHAPICNRCTIHLPWGREFKTFLFLLTISASWPLSQPMLATSAPAMPWLSLSVANE